MPTLAQFNTQYANQSAAGVAKVIERYSKVAPLLSVRKIESDFVHRFAKETSLGGVGRRRLNQAPPDTTGGVAAPAEEPLAIITRKVKTDHRMVSANADARGDEIARASRAIARDMDDQIVNGVRSSDGLGINGLAARCEGNQVIEAGPNGAQLTLAMVEDLIDQVIDQGAGRHLLLNKPLWRKMKRLIVAEAGGATVADVTGEVPKYEDVMVHVVGDAVDGGPILDFDETKGSSDLTSSIYCFAPGTDDVELSGVKLLMASNSIEVIPEGTRDAFVHDLVEVCFGLAVYDATAVARLEGVLAPA